MVPTVLGVILLTFVLFNAAGGDPAMVRLGQHASARNLEEYDEQRGLNKPLIMGLWGTTRVYAKTDFRVNPGPWAGVDGVEYSGEPVGRIVVAPGEYEIPLQKEAFMSGATYRALICYRTLDPGAGFVLKASDGSGVTVSAGFIPDSRWRKGSLVFDTGDNASQTRCLLAIEGGNVEIRELAFQRKAEHLFDSQLMFFLRQIVSFDFGRSDATNQKISTMILEGIFPSLALTVPIFVIGLVLSVSIALVCAFFRDTFIDRFLVILCVVFMSVSYLVWIIGGQYFFAYRLGWFPIWGFESARYIFLPVIIGVLSGLGGSIRFYRTIMLDEMYKDYVRTAAAKGVGNSGILFRHVLKNAMIPILTSVVMTIPFLYTGSLLLESFFGIPGLGRMSFNAINSSDFDVIKAVVFIGAVIYVFANLLTDICYALVDPRVRLK